MTDPEADREHQHDADDDAEQLNAHTPTLAFSLELGEPIADAAYRLPQLVETGRCQRFAQPQYVHVDCALLDVDAATPDAVEQLRSIERAVGMSHQKFEQ